MESISSTRGEGRGDGPRDEEAAPRESGESCKAMLKLCASDPCLGLVSGVGGGPLDSRPMEC